MLVILLFLVGPIILGARLLGADWELAIFAGLVFYPALFALTFILATLILWMIETVEHFSRKIRR